MFKKRCGVPSAWQRFCRMPGYLPSSASKSSERLRAAHWNVSAPAVNLRSGGGMRRVMDTKPLIEPKNKSKIKRQKAKGKNWTQPTQPLRPTIERGDCFRLLFLIFDFCHLPFDFFPSMPPC